MGLKTSSDISSDFQIDNKSMPKPSTTKTKYAIQTTESQRLPANGKLITDYLQTLYETTWTYKYMDASAYDLLFNAYIKSCKTNNSIEHSFKTIDSNTGNSLSYTMYTQSDFEAPMYYLKNGVRYYKDVTFVFVGVGGEG